VVTEEAAPWAEGLRRGTAIGMKWSSTWVLLRSGPETRALIERVAATVIVQVELGPKTPELIGEFSGQGEEPQAGDAPSAR
jgi:hypothetical protein